MRWLAVAGPAPAPPASPDRAAENGRAAAARRGGREPCGDRRNGVRAGAYQCTPRISEAKATCSLVGCLSTSPLPFMPFAAAESGNRRNAVFMRIS